VLTASDRYTQDNSASITSGSAGSSTETSSPNAGVAHKRNIGPITGGIVGGVLGVLLILCLTGLIFRRQMQPKDSLGVSCLINLATFLLNPAVATPYTGERSAITGMPSKSVPISVPPRPLLLAPQPQPQSPLTPPLTVHSETIPSGNQQAIDVSTQQSTHPLTLRSMPNRNEPALSTLEDPPPPYIPRRSRQVLS
jgi:hypothetical protein